MNSFFLVFIAKLRKFISIPELRGEILNFSQHIAALTFGIVEGDKKEKRQTHFNNFSRLSGGIFPQEESGQENFSVFLMRENNIFIEKLSPVVVQWGEWREEGKIKIKNETQIMVGSFHSVSLGESSSEQTWSARLFALQSSPEMHL